LRIASSARMPTLSCSKKSSGGSEAMGRVAYRDL
jgi:hypothetical protein